MDWYGGDDSLRKKERKEKGKYIVFTTSAPHATTFSTQLPPLPSLVDYLFIF